MQSRFILLILFLLSAIDLFSQKTEGPVFIEGEYIVFLKSSVATPVVENRKRHDNRLQQAELNKLARDKNLQLLKDVQNKNNIKTGSVLLEFADIMVGFSAKLTETEKKKLEEDPSVESVFPDLKTGLDAVPAEDKQSAICSNHNQLFPKYSGSGKLFSTIYPGDFNLSEHKKATLNGNYFSQEIPCGISKAGGSVDGSGKRTWIWILDTGIDLDHPDLNVVTSPGIVRSFAPRESVDDGNGHGTHCAGIAAAKNNDFGVVGVSAGAPVVPIKVLTNTGSGKISWMFAGLNHVAKHDKPGDVINVSLGLMVAYETPCEDLFVKLRTGIRNLGVNGTYVVMASGNNNGDAIKFLPACINGTGLFTVGAISCTDVCYNYSNWNKSSNVPVDWAAVGVNVYSTYKNGGYNSLSGTSMAAPVVAGIIHARGGAPLVGGTVFCKEKPYKIAVRTTGSVIIPTK